MHVNLYPLKFHAVSYKLSTVRSRPAPPTENIGKSSCFSRLGPDQALPPRKEAAPDYRFTSSHGGAGGEIWRIAKAPVLGGAGRIIGRSLACAFRGVAFNRGIAQDLADAIAILPDTDFTDLSACLSFSSLRARCSGVIGSVAFPWEAWG